MRYQRTAPDKIEFFLEYNLVEVQVWIDGFSFEFRGAKINAGLLNVASHEIRLRQQMNEKY